MKNTTLILLALIAVSAVRADVPAIEPTVRARQYVQRVLFQILRDAEAADKIVVADGADKDKLRAEKTALETKIAAAIKALTGEQLTTLKQIAMDQEAALKDQMDKAANQDEKDKLAERLKPYKTLRERFLQASADSNDGMANAGKGTALFAGLALALAFASAGLIYARGRK